MGLTLWLDGSENFHPFLSFMPPLPPRREADPLIARGGARGTSNLPFLYFNPLLSTPPLHTPRLTL